MSVDGSLWKAFSNTPLTNGLTDVEKERLFELCEVRRFEAGASLFREGDAADSLWVVLSGDVEISLSKTVLAEVGPGASLGELSLFRAVPTRSATARAICPVTALRVSGPRFQKLLVAYDLIALKVVNNLAHQMAERLVALNDKLLGGGRKGLAVARTELRRVIS